MKLERALVFNPPTGLYQRGEDRCQAAIDGSAATTLRAPNDLGYIASQLRRIGVEPKIRDYPAEGKNWTHFLKDIEESRPDFLVMSITTTTIEKDMDAFRMAKDFNPDVLTIAKGAHFWACEPASLEKDVFKPMDIAIRGEAETIINNLILTKRKSQDIQEVAGIIYLDYKRSTFMRTRNAPFIEDLDSLPFPARDLMRNECYTRPDTGAPQATLQVSRGCPAECIYCLSPIISGKRLRKRSARNVVEEVEECVKKYHIRNFFFRADTFTMDRDWAIEISKGIIRKKLNIEWVANSRVKPLDRELLEYMKKAGCWLIALGIESGSEETLEKIKKGASKDDARDAVRMAHEVGLKTYGFFMLGFPWESEEHINETIEFSRELDCDFTEIHVPMPYKGTELYKIAKEAGLVENNAVGHDYFSHPLTGTLYLTREELIRLRAKALRTLYLRPRYIIRTLSNVRSPGELKAYAFHGLKLLKTILTSY
jgi:radical SAM superfamily enzyme YgiQ (UPF0313 family)